jgi:hypothetical protein
MFDIPFFKTTPFVEEHFSAELLEKLGRTRTMPPNEVVAYVEGLLGDRHSQAEGWDGDQISAM